MSENEFVCPRCGGSEVTAQPYPALREVSVLHRCEKEPGWVMPMSGRGRTLNEAMKDLEDEIRWFMGLEDLRGGDGR